MDKKWGNKMNDTNEMRLKFLSKSTNEGFARVAVAAFLTNMNPTLEEVEDVKTAVSEAVTNAIIHGYQENEDWIGIECQIKGNEFTIRIEDKGQGIANVKQAMEPLFTTRPDLERSGMGFAFMEAFMDDLVVDSTVGEGTRIIMRKRIGAYDTKYEE